MNLAKSVCIFFSIHLWTSILFAAPAALVIIDMQSDFSYRGGKEKIGVNGVNLNSVIQRQVELIEVAKRAGAPIVLVEYINYGKTNKSLLKTIGKYSDVLKLEKDTDGMFDRDSIISKELEQYLAEREIHRLVMTGANGAACVVCSLVGALVNGFHVYVDPKAIIDFNSDPFIYPFEYEKRIEVKADYPMLNNLIQSSNSVYINEVLSSDSPNADRVFDNTNPNQITCRKLLQYKGE